MQDPVVIKSRGQLITDNIKMGSNLAKNIKCMMHDDPLDYMSMPNNLCIYLYPCTSGIYPCTSGRYPCTSDLYPGSSSIYPCTSDLYPCTSDLYPCTSGEIESITKCLSNTKAVSLDGFSMKQIKYIIKDIYVPLSAAFNSSFVAGVFSDALKHAKVVPVFKTGEKFNITNYRPISVLPVLSKILEKRCIIVLYHFMNSCKLLCDN